MHAPLRILHAVKGLSMGGAEKVMQLMVQHLDRTRFDPAVCSFADGERGPLLRESGVPTHIGPDMDRVLDRLQPHVVHVHRAGWAEKDLLAPVKRHRRGRTDGLPLVVETNVFGRHDPSPLGGLVHRRLFVSRFCLDRYRSLYDPTAGPPAHDYLYNPVDTDFFAAHPAEPANAGPVVGRLSRPDPGKWSPLALEFLPHLARLVPDFRYLVVGGVDAARGYVRAHGLEDRVVFLDPLLTDADLAGFFRKLRVLAHANDTGETFGLAIAEAMAAGLPVVTHPSAWPKDNAQLEVVDDGRTGLVAATPEEYARQVARLLQDPEAARSMGYAGREKARELYRVQTVVRRLEEIYTSGVDELSAA